MQGVIGYGESLGTIHAALTCVTTSSGQAVCTEPSSGFLAGFGILLIIEIAIVVLGIVAAVKIVSKAGYSGWWVLIALIPIVGSVFFLVFAFSTWPVTLEVQRLKSLAGRTYGGPQGFGGGWARGDDAAAPGATPGVTDHENVAMPSFGQFLRGETGDDATSPPQTQQPAAGWYPSPGGSPGQQRYWDGTGWTDHFA